MLLTKALSSYEILRLEIHVVFKTVQSLLEDSYVCKVLLAQLCRMYVRILE